MEVEPHRSVFKKEIKVDPKSLIVALGKATLNGAFLNWNGVAEEGIEVLTSLGLETTPAEIAGLLIVRALMGAMETLLKESAASLVQQPDNLKDLYKELNSSLASGELAIDAGFFQHPRDLKIVGEAQQGFARWLGEFVATETEAQAISRRLPAYFVLALNEEWGERSADYDVLRNELDTPFTPAMQREQKWLQYRAWLQKQVEEPVFLEAFSLKQVYVPLRAYYEEKEESKEEALARGSKATKRVVSN